MRFLSHLITLLIVTLLAACGGGGGSPGLQITGSVSTFAVAAPASLTLSVGSSQQYTVQGGVKPYTVFSNNPAVVTGWLIGENVVAVGASAAGTGIVTVQDSKGASFTIAVAAGSSAAFFTTAPTALTIAPGPFASQTYKLGGGVPPYKAVSQVPSVVSVVVNGTDVTITALQIPGTGTFAPVAITFTDSSSTPNSLTSTVTVGTIPLAIFPTNTTLLVGDTTSFVITGGTPPYHFVLLDQCATSAQIVQGNTLQVTGFEVCSGSTITILDANNQTPLTPATFAITAGSSGLNINPSALTVPENANEPDLKLTVYGAKGGSIQVFSTNTAIFAPLTPVKNADGTYTITLTGGNTCSLAVTPGSAAQPAVTTGPVASQHPFIPAVPPTGGDQSATITVLDALGNIGTSTVIVKDTNGIGGC